MKRLVCEMCGSTDLIKEDGVFVCQTCGCKYSLEEARKMMVEGTVEVTGTVKVDNSNQLENLRTLALSSFESKNYSKAEELCNQIIAIDGKNYEAWKLKGEAINWQINANNPRILEVYNCIINAYNVLEDSQKESHKDEILDSLKVCLEGELDFWLNQLENNRPTDESRDKVKFTYEECYKMLSEAFDELGFDANDKIAYLNNFDNFLISKTNVRCVSTWKTTVGYNYYRDDFGNLGKYWKKSEKDYSNGWRPNREIRDTFADEIIKMCSLLEFCIEKFNPKTPIQNKIDIYQNLIFFRQQLLNSYSFKRMVETTRNGYGAIINQQEYWLVDTSLTNTQIQNSKIAGYNFQLSALKTQKNIEVAKKKAEAAMKEKEEKEKRFNEYWNKNSKRKLEIDNEILEINKQISDLNTKIISIDSETEKSSIMKKIKGLSSERDGLGIFKNKEKKELQNQIDQLNSQVAEIEKNITSRKDKINGELKNLNLQKKKLEDELQNKPESDKPDEDELNGLILKFGNYYIDSTDSMEPLKWKILERNGNKALIITKYAINGSAFDPECSMLGDRPAFWNTSALRNWLNDEFYNIAFSDEEKEKIQNTDVKAHINPGFSVDCGLDTCDKIFSLSIYEAEKYFSDDQERICHPTSAAKEKGITGGTSEKYAENCQWWLRTTGKEKGCAVSVGRDGAIGRNGGNLYVGHGAWDSSVGIRPAMWVIID